MEGHDASPNNKKVEIDTSAPFRSVKEAVVLFGERVLAGEIYTNRLKEILEILSEIQGIDFLVDPLEKQVGDDIMALLQQGKKFNNGCSDTNELETFHQAASKLGITSSRAALREIFHSHL
ncbi:hypothetical protein ACET3Z_028238 [Daucus carota]